MAGGRGGWWAGLDGRNRRALVVAAVFVAVLIAFLGVKLVGGGGGGAPAAGPVSPVTTLAPGIPGGLPATTSTTAGGTTASTGQVFSSKDPFQPPRGFVTATTATGGTGSSGGPGTTATTTTVASGSAGAGTAGGTTDGSTAPSGRQQVELLDVYATGGTDYASVRVNDTVYRASPGQTFDTDYRVVDLALSSGCGDFSFQSKGFHLCKGQQVVE